MDYFSRKETVKRLGEHTSDLQNWQLKELAARRDRIRFYNRSKKAYFFSDDFANIEDYFKPDMDQMCGAPFWLNSITDVLREYSLSKYIFTKLSVHV